MKTSEFVKVHIGTLEHFIEQKGWPIRLRDSEIKDLSNVNGFTVKDGLVSCEPKKLPPRVLAEFWKFKYMEAKSDANKLYNAIDDAYRKANS